MNTLAFNLDQVQGMLAVVTLLVVFLGGCHLFVKLKKSLDEWFFEQPYAQEQRTKELKADRDALGTAKAELKQARDQLKGKVSPQEHKQVTEAKKRLQNKCDDLVKQVSNLKDKLEGAERTVFQQETLLNASHQHPFRPPSTVRNEQPSHYTTQGGLGSGF